MKILKSNAIQKVNVDFWILAFRLLLAWVFIGYGYSKLFDNQFGLTPNELNLPVNELSLFKLSWYIFDHEPFKTFIGVSQIICGLLLIFRRTALLGAFLFLPIVVNILIIDLTIMSEQMAIGFSWRLGWYILLDLLIIWSHKSQIKIIWEKLWEKKPFSKSSIWAYLLLPLLVGVVEIVGWLPRILIAFIENPSKTLEQLSELFDLLFEGLQTFL